MPNEKTQTEPVEIPAELLEQVIGGSGSGLPTGQRVHDDESPKET